MITFRKTPNQPPQPDPRGGSGADKAGKAGKTEAQLPAQSDHKQDVEPKKTKEERLL